VRYAFGPVTARPTYRFVPAAEASRDSDAIIRLELPWLDVAKDVAVEVEDGQLVVRGEAPPPSRRAPKIVPPPESALRLRTVTS